MAEMLDHDIMINCIKGWAEIQENYCYDHIVQAPTNQQLNLPFNVCECNRFSTAETKGYIEKC